MNKRGFTLIELLAILIISGIILLIIVPKINSVVDNSNKNIAYENTERLVNSLNEYYVRMQIEGNFSGCSYDFDNDFNNCLDYSFEGNKPKGSISISSSGSINGIVYFNGYCLNISNGIISYVGD